MPTAPIPLTDGQVASAEDSVGHARTVTNWLPDALGNNVVRPGITNATFDPANNRVTSGPATDIIGTYVWTNPVDRYDYLIYVRRDRRIFARNLVTLDSTALSSAVLSTQLDGAAPRPTFAEDSVRLIIAGGGALQTWTGVVGVLSARLAVYTLGVNQPPLAATHVVKLANYVVANNLYPGSLNQFFWSQIGDGVDNIWPPLNFNTADASADSITAVHASLRELYCFGPKTVQVYGVTADSSLPFQASSALSLGLGAPYSIIPLDQTFALLDTQKRFVQTDGRSFQVLSDAIAKTVIDIPAISDCWSFRAIIGHWDLLVWVFPTAKVAYAYEQNQKKWAPLRGWNGVDDWTSIRMGSYAYWPGGSMHLIGDSLYENVFTWEAGARNDVAPDGTNTLPIVAERITGRIDYATSARKRCNGVRVTLRRGTAAGVSAALELSKSDDDGPWSTPATLDLGTVAGDTASWRNWFPGGVYRRRQYRIRYSGAAEAVVAGIEENYSVMAS